jgi:hypothetical protein
VKDENELRYKHEENMKFLIDNYIGNNSNEEDEEAMIKNITEDFDDDFHR